MNIDESGNIAGHFLWTHTTATYIHDIYEFTSGHIDEAGQASITCRRAGDNESQTLILIFAKVINTMHGEGQIIWYGSPFTAGCNVTRQ